MRIPIKKKYLSYLIKKLSIGKKLKVIWWNLKNKSLWAPYPLRAQIEIDRRCNLNCVMCTRTKLNNLDTFMSRDSFIEILDKLDDTVCEIMVHGWGESMLHPEYFDILSDVNDRGILLNIVTNGTKLDSGTIAQLLILNPNKISISVDSGISENYEEIRKGANYIEFFENVLELVNQRNRLNMTTQINFFSTIGTYNINDIESLVELKDVLGVDYISFSILLSFQEYKHSSIEYDIKENANSLDIFERWREYYSKRKDIGFIKLDDVRTCVQPKIDVFIDVVGDIYPCGCIVGAIEPLGNIFEIDDFQAFYTSEVYDKFREQSLSGEIEACRRCEHWGSDITKI